MGSEDITIAFGDVELEQLAEFLETVTTKQITQFKGDPLYLLRAIHKVIQANNEQ